MSPHVRRLLLGALGAVVLVGGVSGAATASGDPNLARAMAFVRAKGCYSQDTSMWMKGWRFNALYGNCRAGDGRDQHVWFFTGGRFIGNDTPTSTKEWNSSREIIGVWRDLDTIAFIYVLYRPSDAMCCPRGGGRIVRFQYAKGQVAALDPIPPRVSNRTVGR